MLLKHKNKIQALAIIIFLAVGIFEAAFFYISRQIKPEYYQEQVLDAIKKQTGQTVKINGGARFMLFPSPRLVFYDLVVDGSSSTIPSIPTFSIEKVEIHIEAASILSNQMRISQVALVSPVLSVNRADDNTIHWDWLNIKLLKLLNSTKGVSLPLSIVNGTFNYKDTINNKSIVIDNVDASTTYGTKISLDGTLEFNDTPYNFAIDSKAMDLSVSDTQFPLNLNLTDQDKNTLAIQSVIDTSGDLPKVTGKLSATTDDLENFLQDEDNRKANDNHVVMNLALDGIWELENGILQMHKVNMKGLNSEGKGDISVGWENWYPTISVNMDFSSIDYLMLKNLSTIKIAKKKVKKTDLFQQEYGAVMNVYKDNPLPDNIEVRINIHSEKIVSGSEEWRNLNINAVLDKGALTVNQCDIHLMGDGLLTVFGVVSQGGNGDLRFEGNIEAKGRSLRHAITMLYPSASDLPSIGTGEFSINANLYVNKSQIRLFEADAVVDGTPVLGTVTAFLDPELRFEAKIRLKDINFDSIRDIYKKENLDAEIRLRSGKQEEIQPNVAGFDWLRNLTTRVDATVYIDNFNFMERKGDRVSLSLYAYDGDLRIPNMQLTYSDGISELNGSLNVKNSVPNISLMVNADQIDTNYFNLNEKNNGNTAADSADNEIKNKDIGNFPKLRDESEDTAVPVEWMDRFNGVFDITLRKLIHKNTVIEKIKFRGRVDNKKLDIQKLSFVYSQAQSNVTGILYGGKIPGLNINFTMSNADIYEMLNPVANIHNINGFASLSGVITTNGWSFYEWLNHMDAKLLIAARGVKVQGINLAGVNNVVDVARTSADVFNNVNNVLTKGTSEFLVDGSFNIKDGELRAPGLNIRSGLITGSIVGGTQLETMNGQFTIQFRFGNLLSDITPTMIIQLSGKINKPDIKVDTASLEDYVARRNVSK